jgi:uncharacterized protein YaiI (UPF0178 family)
MRRWFAGAIIALMAWIAITFALPFFGNRQLAVVGVDAAKVVAAADGRIVELRQNAVLAVSDDNGFAVRLYANGAALVMEGRIGAACFAPISSD